MTERSSSSPPGWRGGLSRNVVILGFVSLLNDGASEMIYPLLPAFLTAVLGAGPAALGIIEGIAETTASLLKLYSGYLSDRVRRRKGWIVAGYSLSNIIRPLIAFSTSWTFKLLIAGGGGGKLDHYTRLTDTMGLGSVVRFLGLVQDIERIYPIADMYVLPTLADPCPLAPLEAMAAGVATIMSGPDFNGSAELIRNGEALLLSDPRDPHEIAQALKTLMDSRVRQELAEKRRQVVREFTWDKTAAETLSAYRDVMRRKRLHREAVGSCRATGIS